MQNVLNGESSSTSLEGNGCEIIVGPHTCQVDITVSDKTVVDPEGVFATAEVVMAVRGFGHFLQMPKSVETQYEISLS